MFKKADIVLALLLVLLCGGTTFWVAHTGTSGAQVEITVGGKLYGTYSLFENQDITIKQHDHLNVVSIHDGQVSMIHANCPNQLCVKQGAISRSNQTIVCLPNQVMVEIVGKHTGKDHSDADVISY